MNMTKLFSPRRYCCCYRCPDHRHPWRKTLCCGIFVFGLYFALLSFVSFLAVSTHQGMKHRPTGVGVGRGPSLLISHQLGSRNGSVDPHHHHQHPNLLGVPPFGIGGGGPSPNGSRDLGLLTIQKTGVGSNSARYSIYASPRRDVAYASDIIRSQAIFKCVPVHFRQDPGATVALASFPGSGNTWLRYLLQLGTGIFTGSVYKDFALLRNGFPGESITNGCVLVVKTHESGPMARSQFEKAILLVRKPAEAILAEFNRRAAGHIGHAGKDKYMRNAGRYWSSFVTQKGRSWTETNLDWIDGFHGPLLISMYHQLVQNTTQELTTILDFLGEPVNETAMACVLNNKEGIYRRRKKNIQFQPYTPAMEQYLAKQERIVYNAIQRRIRRDAKTTLAPSVIAVLANAKNNHGLNNFTVSNRKKKTSTILK